jgi:hypothetical protein
MPVQVSFQIGDGPDLATGWIARLSLAGVDIVGVDDELLRSTSIGTKIAFHAALDPSAEEIYAFEGRIQWVAAGGRVGIQFGQLGARETHAILQAMQGGAVH